MPSASADPANATSASAPVVSPARYLIDLFPFVWRLQAEYVPCRIHWVGLFSDLGPTNVIVLKLTIRVLSLHVDTQKLCLLLSCTTLNVTQLSASAQT